MTNNIHTNVMNTALNQINKDPIITVPRKSKMEINLHVRSNILHLSDH